MIKIYQPADLILTFTDTDGATGARIRYQKPSGATGYWTSADGVSIGTGEVTFSIPAGELDEVGKWRFMAFITYSGGNEYPGKALTQYVDKLDA